MSRGHHWVYILEVKNGNYYTGYTTNLARRYWQHRNGKGAKYTRSFPPRRIAQCWRIIGTKGMAMKVEYFIKQQRRQKKELIVENPLELAKMINNNLDIDLAIYAFDPKAAEKSSEEKDWKDGSKRIDPFDSLPQKNILTYEFDN